MDKTLVWWLSYMPEIIFQTGRPDAPAGHLTILAWKQIDIKTALACVTIETIGAA